MLQKMHLKVTFLLLITLLFKSSSCSSSPFNSVTFDFDRIKNEVFLNTDSTNISTNIECLSQLTSIQQGLNNSEQWALEVLDSWGKLPSGVLTGNLFEMGAFSQCFNIEKRNQLYETQYCIARLPADFSSFNGGRSHQLIPEKALISMGLGRALSIGICLPKACSAATFENLINEVIGFHNIGNITIKIPEASCQLEENNTKLKTIDIIAIALLASVSCLMILSTAYDVICEIKKKEKSRVFLIFSVYTNGSKLISCTKSESANVVHCLHGIRVITTAWVLLGHTFFAYLVFPTRNKSESTLGFLSKYHNMFIASSYVSVDTFFFLSGFLVSIKLLRQLQKTNGRINIVSVYFHRFLRLTPLLAVSILFAMTLLRFLGSGPIWRDIIGYLSGQCERKWWATLLYVNNYVRSDDMCFIPTWYLSADTQLFILAPFLVWILYKLKARYVLPLYVIGVILCVSLTIATSWYDNLPVDDMSSTGSTVKKTYFPTHMRYSPWLIGIICGYVVKVQQGRKMHISKMVNFMAWFMTLILMLTVIFANYPLQQPDIDNAPIEYGVYDALSRVAWSLALSYIIFACVNGYGGPVNWFLSLPLWQPLSRISYSMYLLHFVVIIIMNASMKQALYFTEYIAYHAFFGYYVLTVMLSIVATLAFESPIVAIEKIIFGQGNNSKTFEATQEENNTA